MCGILGISATGGLKPSLPALRLAMDRLRLRGPDDEGSWSDEHAALGHLRLSIVDLSPAGHQPMESSDRRYVIVYNGEIYNHADLRRELLPVTGWRGSSDTETLIEAYRKWGVECLQRLNGMFAFAIWDRQERSWFIARDRMGVKPLYYADRRGRFAFASRPHALALLLEEGPLQINSEALRLYLELGYVPAPLSFHRDMHKLPAAHYLIVNERGVRRVRYWDFRCIAPEMGWLKRSEGDLVEDVQSLMRDAVRIRLMSDVPLGAFLSGGVDSALIVAAMKTAGVEHPKAFTVGFNEARFDEGPAAARAAQLLGVDHILETMDVNSLLDLLPTYVDQYDEPFADSSAFPTMAVARLARRHVTVALTGDGADELFGGYHYYRLMERLLPLLRMRGAWKRRAQQMLRVLPMHQAKLLAGAFDASGAAALFNYLRSTGKDYPRLVEPEVLETSTPSHSWFEQFAASFAVDLPPCEIAMRLDAGFTLPEMFLQKVDIATMAFSLEARCPMTDYRLVEWAMRLPAHYKIRGGYGKYLLRQALRRHLPAELVYKPKMGFGVPIAQWLRGPLREWAHDLIHDETLISSVPLNRAKVRELLHEQLKGKRESHPLLWSVLMLLCFMQRYRTAATAGSIGYREVA
jgi:asparagine synthase (glutamine-hydrolysing)